jgi:hypothetical protein
METLDADRRAAKTVRLLEGTPLFGDAKRGFTIRVEREQQPIRRPLRTAEQRRLRRRPYSHSMVNRFEFAL